MPTGRLVDKDKSEGVIVGTGRLVDKPGPNLKKKNRRNIADLPDIFRQLATKMGDKIKSKLA